MGITQAESALSTIIQDTEELMQDGPGPTRTIVMSGTPLAGKSHMVSLMEKFVPGKFLIVRSDYVRPAVAHSLGRKRPAYDDIEHAATFIVASEVVRAGLSMNWPVVCDATNLNEEFRRWAYEPADDLKAEVLVVFMQVTDEVAMSRLSERQRHGSAATYDVFQKLKFEMESISKCTRPYVVIDSDGDLTPDARNLAKWLTGKIDKVPGQKKPQRKKTYASKPEPERESTDEYVSKPYWKDRKEEHVSEEPEQEPVLTAETKKKSRKVKPKDGKRVVYDFYTGEPVEINE